MPTKRRALPWTHLAFLIYCLAIAGIMLLWQVAEHTRPLSPTVPALTRAPPFAPAPLFSYMRALLKFKPLP